MKTKIIPFDLETAKKIQSGEIEGRIVNECGTPVEIVAFNVKNTPAPIVCIIRSVFDTDSMLFYFKKDGTSIDTNVYSLTIELPEETPKYEFKVGNKVRVNLPKDVVTKYLILGNYQGKVATIINVEGSYVKVKADGLQPYSFDVDYLIPYEEKHEFKPFDKVLVRDLDTSEWRPRLYSRKGRVGYCMQDCCEYMQILPYEGNEHLVGTTDKPE